MPSLHSCQASYSYHVFLPVHSGKCYMFWQRDMPVYEMHNDSGQWNYKSFTFDAVTCFSYDLCYQRPPQPHILYFLGLTSHIGHENIYNMLCNILYRINAEKINLFLC